MDSRYGLYYLPDPDPVELSIFARYLPVYRCFDFGRDGGKSGQHRAPYHLKSWVAPLAGTESVTENIPPDFYGLYRLQEFGKGENVR